MAKVSQRMSDLFQVEIDTIGINSKQFGALLVIYEVPYISQKEVGDNLKIDRTTIGQQIDVLEKLQLIERLAHQSDRRMNCLVVTTKGEIVIKTLWEKMKNCEMKVISELSPNEKKMFETISKITMNKA